MRILLAIAFTALSLLITTKNAIASDENTFTILVLGDSLSAAYGIEKEKGWVNLLRERLKDEATVINASISGETTDGGLASLPSHLSRYQPDIVMLELGANDGLRGFPLPMIKTNLRGLIEQSKQAGAHVLLIGIHIPPNYGTRYATAFHDIYGELATEYDLALVPFLLEGVALKPELMQDDRLHPKAEGQPQILENVFPALKDLMDSIKASNQHASLENQAPLARKNMADH